MSAAYEGQRYIEYRRVVTPPDCRRCGLAAGVAAVGNEALRQLRQEYDERPDHESSRSPHCWVSVVRDAELQTDERYVGLAGMHSSAEREMDGIRRNCKVGATDVHTAGEETLIACGYGVPETPPSDVPPIG